MGIVAQPLTPEAYKPYGDVVSVRDDLVPTDANMGTAKRYDFTGRLENLRQGAKANLCVFRSQPFIGAQGGDPFEVRMLERHAFSTQAFLPMTCPEKYLVIVAQGGDAPDLTTLKAFIARRDQGITYYPGTWHHPLIALDAVTDFACVVWEDGGAGDCQVHRLGQMVPVLFRS